MNMGYMHAALYRLGLEALACSTPGCREDTDTCKKKEKKKKYVAHPPANSPSPTSLSNPSKRPLQQYMLRSPIPTFYILQSVIYAAVSASKQAKANSPAESLQMHGESSPPCHTHSSASQRQAERGRAPRTCSRSTAGPRRTWPPTLNMEML